MYICIYCFSYTAKKGTWFTFLILSTLFYFTIIYHLSLLSFTIAIFLILFI